MQRRVGQGAPGLPAGWERLADLGSATLAQTLTILRVDPEQGLSEHEVSARRADFGSNEVTEQKAHPVLNFLAKFWGLSAWTLELIIILSAILGRYTDLALVSVLLVVNAVLEFWQERRSQAVVDALRTRLQVEARVLRAGQWQPIPARDLVPGDVVRVRAGDVVPADLRLLSGTVSVDQSALTGESVDVEKSPGEVVASGSVVRRSEGGGVVIATGSRTLFGRTTDLVQQAQPKLHIEAVVATVVRWLFVIVAALALVVVILVQVRRQALVDSLPVILVLLMSAIPVSLPVMFTTSMTVGARELARNGVLVTRLSATEDAASMDVLCTDKTGTITTNQLSIKTVLPVGQTSQTQVLAAGALASEEANQDPIDLAFLAMARQRRVFDDQPAATLVSFTPFDASTRRTEVTIEQDGQRLRVIKGAVHTVAEACGLSQDEADALQAGLGPAIRTGQRVLAVAAGPQTATPTLLGLVTLADPLRPDSADLIAKLADLGVSVKMLTGDGLAVAEEIAHEVGLHTIVRAADIADAQALGENADPLAGVDGLAEVYPEDKYLVVKRLQDAGHVTGMTGDGVNDAPALRQAEVGIAVSTATDVAKSAASVVLTQPGLANIVPLVQQGRTIYQRILSWIINKISRTLLKATFVAIPFIFTGKFMISALTMLLLVFITDFAKITLATDHVQPSARPETWRIGGYISMSIVIGAAMAAEALGLLWYGWTHLGLSENDAVLESFSMITVLYFSVFSIISVRERRLFWRSAPSRAVVIALTLTMAGGTAFTFAGTPGFAPLPWPVLGLVTAVSAVSCLVVNDFIKAVLIRRWTPLRDGHTIVRKDAISHQESAQGGHKA